MLQDDHPYIKNELARRTSSGADGVDAYSTAAKDKWITLHQSLAEKREKLGLHCG